MAEPEIGTAAVADTAAAEHAADESPTEVPSEPTTVETTVESDGARAVVVDESADVVRAAEVTRTWHPGGPDEAPGTRDEPVDADATVEVPSAPGVAAGDTTDVASEAEADPAAELDLTGDAILLVGADAADGVDPAVETEPADAEPEPATDDHEGERGVAVIPLGVVTTSATPSPRKKRTIRVAREAPAPEAPVVLSIDGLVKRFGDTTAVDAISLGIRAGSFYGIVGPNGAGKTTTLSMITGLLRPDGGSVHVNGIDVWKEPRAAKRITGVLPDRLRLFDRLTGAEMLYYAGSLRGLDHRTVLDRSADLAEAFGLEDALDRLVADYSAGMTKKIALACAMIHSPRMLVLDEPFESVDPVSAANLTDILERYVAGGGTVLLSSHSMDLIERVCDSAAIIVGGRVLASGTLDEVRRGDTLEDRFVELAGGRKAAEGMEWLHSFSD
ncbi:ABC transporter ATP-binding protein [Agromyces sp. SYSU T00266]|uniref:ABC transporter ATP-binding protein n=1 Tax=Agromyces zhanjiangensis TaxID=3158562 RepID=UPI0033942288